MGASIPDIHALVGDLAAASLGATFNQYRDSDGDDATPAAPGIRRENLVRYLAARRAAPILLVAEAAGWRGARYSGLCLYSERQLSGEPGLRRSSRHPLGWSEPSATVVQAAIAPFTDHVVLWNLVPTHPRLPSQPHSNRTPSRAELRAGIELVRRLRHLLGPRHVGAIGRLAAAAMGDVPAVRHPSHGGAVLCTAQLRELLTGPWAAAVR